MYTLQTACEFLRTQGVNLKPDSLRKHITKPGEGYQPPLKGKRWAGRWTIEAIDLQEFARVYKAMQIVRAEEIAENARRRAVRKGKKA